jgi:hypothetical protein
VDPCLTREQRMAKEDERRKAQIEKLKCRTSKRKKIGKR